MLPECVTQAPFYLTTTWTHRRSNSVEEAEQRDSQHLNKVMNISAKALNGECTPPSQFVPQKSRLGCISRYGLPMVGSVCAIESRQAFEGAK